MDLFRIAARLAKLLPFPELKDRAVKLFEKAHDDDVRALLTEIITEADKGSSKAYLLWEDLMEMFDEVDYASKTLDANWRQNNPIDEDWMKAVGLGTVNRKRRYLQASVDTQ